MRDLSLLEIKVKRLADKVLNFFKLIVDGPNRKAIESRSFVLIFLTVATITLYGQAIEKCDRTVLLMISQGVGSLKQPEITDFLLTFGKECRNNAEFSEWSNELLFSVLNKQTDLLLKAIEKEKNEIELDVILEELGSPIHDLIDIKTLIPKVEKAKIDKDLKKKILERLKMAYDSTNKLGER